MSGNPESLSQNTMSEKIYPFFVKEKKNGRGRGDKYLEERNIFLEEREKILFMEEKEEILFFKRKKCLFQRRRKTYFSLEEKEKILFFFRGEGKNTFFWRRRKRIEKFGKGKNIFCGGEEKRRRKRRKNICRRKIR